MCLHYSFVCFIQGGMIDRREPTLAKLQKQHLEHLHKLSSPLYQGKGRLHIKLPSTTQTIPVDNKNIHNIKTKSEEMKLPQCAFEAKQPIKEKKSSGKKGKKPSNNKDVLRKQISVFNIKQYKLSRRLQHKPICKVHGMGFISWWEYCGHLLQMHGHLEKYPCKMCKTECSSL